MTVTGGGLDLASISTFKGAANVFITKYYDQVGTNHEVQANASQQAQLILFGLGIASGRNLLVGSNKRLCH